MHKLIRICLLIVATWVAMACGNQEESQYLPIFDDSAGVARGDNDKEEPEEDTEEPEEGIQQLSELIKNGGNEMDLIAGEIPYWNEDEGENWTQRSSNPAPFEMDHYFYAGDGAYAILSQTIDVSDIAEEIDNGDKEFQFYAYLRVYNQTNPDSSKVIVQYKNDMGDILDSFESFESTAVDKWERVEDIRHAVPDTRSIKIMLIANRNNGNNNDGYFDMVSLKTLK
ncbi:MAG: hypothetical protein HQL32_11665 [Planctomycetes bacterium]|nr:hypothetical protein [Planctomycetota bacterium]